MSLHLLKLDLIPESLFSETNGKKLKIPLLSNDQIDRCIFTATRYDADTTEMCHSLVVRDQTVERISQARAERHEPDSESGIQYRSQTRYTDIGFARGRQE